METLPKFVFKKPEGVWHRMDEEKPFKDKETAMQRRRELKGADDESYKPSIRIIKHCDRYYLYEKKN